MFELGKDEAKLHGAIGEHIANTDTDLLMTIGELSKNIDEQARLNGFKGIIVHSDTLEEFLGIYGQYLEDGDTILVKASHGMHLEKIINSLTK